MTPVNYNRKAAPTVYPKNIKTVARKRPSLGRGRLLATPAQSVPTLLTFTDVPLVYQQYYAQNLQSFAPIQENLAPAMYRPPPFLATGNTDPFRRNAVAYTSRRVATDLQTLAPSAISPVPSAISSMTMNRGLTPAMRGGDAGPCVDMANEESEPDAEVAEDYEMDM